MSFNIISELAEKYPDGLQDKIYEVKSLNSMAFWREDKPIGIPYEHHLFQLSFYQMYNDKGIKDASFLYIDRDSMSISELPNIIKDDTIKKMEDWHKQITYYYQNKIEPEKPELIIFDKKEKKWQLNLGKV